MAHEQRIIVGQRIREAREAAGLTQGQLADKLDTRQGTLSNWERGGVDHKLDSLTAVALALGVTVESLIG